MTYCGPSSSVAPDRLRAIDADRWAFQPKIDGVYCTITTDSRGRVANMLYRSGKLVSLGDADGLPGQYIGLPDSTIYGELEAQTESATRARSARGFALVHLFDAGRIAGRSIAAEPYSARYGWLHRWQAHVECYEPDVASAEFARRDGNGVPHDVLGQFCKASAGAVRRMPIVSLYRGHGAAESLWAEHVERSGGEGVVAVRLDAPLGRRGGKCKCRATTTLDCLVVDVGARAAVLSYRGHSFAVSAGCKAAQGMRQGDVVEVLANGWHEKSVTPKHARVLRVRRDV